MGIFDLFRRKPEDAAFAAPDRNEIATTRDGRDITRGYVDSVPLLQPQDAVLLERGGGDLQLYESIRRDDQVAAVMQQRRLAVISREWEVIPGGDRRRDRQAADALQDTLDNLGTEPEVGHQAASPLTGWDSACDKMLWGTFYGYSVAECLWGRDGRHVVLDQLKVRNRRRFAFAPDFSLRLKTTNNPNGEPLPARKFWTFVTGADNDDEPYGLGLAHWMYWPSLFKRNGIKFWLIFLEKFGQPTSVGKFPANATPDEKTRLLQAVQAIATDTGVILPDGMALELLEAARSGSADYATLVKYMDAIITKVGLGQLMTLEAVGGQYKGEMQYDVRQDLVKADSDLLCGSFNLGPARWLADWNYPGAAYPRVFRRIESEPDLKPQAERDEIITRMGFRPTLKYIQEAYGGEWKELPNTQPVLDAATELLPTQEPSSLDDARRNPGDDKEDSDGFAAPEPGDVVTDYTDQLGRITAQEIDDWVAAASALADEASSMKDLLTRLSDLYPELPAERMTQLLAEGFAAAQLAGRHELNSGQ